MLILGIDTSCDDTCAAVVEDGCKILSNIISSQVEFHREYGGVVPEIASRKHILNIQPVIQQALEKALIDFNQLDAVAVTQGPGLIGSLVIGIAAAKSLSYLKRIPLIPVNHVLAHAYSNFLVEIDIHDSFSPPAFPLLSLVVSGGHTVLLKALSHLQYQAIGTTLDDAAGEAFDKAAKMMGLGYPGGAIVSKLAIDGNPEAVSFPRPMMHSESFDFSFSGLKTAILHHLRRYYGDITSPSSPPLDIPRQDLADICASFQEAVVDVLCSKTINAASAMDIDTIAISGGVAANARLRGLMAQRASQAGIKVYFPSRVLCTDNAAMIAGLGFHLIKQGQTADMSMDGIASLSEMM